MGDYPSGRRKSVGGGYGAEGVEDIDVEEKLHNVLNLIERDGITLSSDAPDAHKFELLLELLGPEGVVRRSNAADPQHGCWACHEFRRTGLTCMICQGSHPHRGWLICACGACQKEGCGGAALRYEVIEAVTRDVSGDSERMDY